MRGEGARNVSSQLSPDVGLHGAALEAGDGGGGVERLGAMLLAALVAVAGVAAAVSRYGRKAGGVAGIAHIVDEGPGAVERRRAQIVLVPAHRVAGGVAHPAVDALHR